MKYLANVNDGVTWSDPLNNEISIQCEGTEPKGSNYAHYTGRSSEIFGNRDGWVKKTLDIGDYIGNSNVKIRFHFNRNDGDANGAGWWIDDVRINSKEFLDFPDKNTTVMVRVFEAVVVPFISTGTSEIKAGDLVSQEDGTTGGLITGVVVVKPIITSGSWLGGNAKGMLWLNKVSQPFKTGTLLLNGEMVATVSDEPRRTNLIKAYYNNLADTGEPHNNPYDQKRLAESRGEFRWPADEGFPTDDKIMIILP